MNWLNPPERGIYKLNIVKLDVYTTEDKGNFIDLLGVFDFNVVTYSIINKLDISSLIAACVIFFFYRMIYPGWN